MTATDVPPESAAPAASAPPPAKPKSELRDTLGFLLKLGIFVFVIRSFIVSPFNIPSESMLPQLYVGDYLFVTKWNYGYSRHSLPFSLPLIPGRIFGTTPARGDVVVFKAPPGNSEDYIKRVIGLPGDTVQMRDGQVILNGRPVPHQRIVDFVIPVSGNYHCPADFQTDAGGKPACRYHAFRETLPDGKSYTTLDRGPMVADDTDVYQVPAGHLFLMGDNRDNSEDSRFSQEVGGIGFVPLENVEGKAALMFYSTDGNSSWLTPWTWPFATRWSRIGTTF